MKLTGYATPEGTRRYRDRLVAAGAAHERHFREGLGGLTLSTIGLGTYLGKQDGATDALYLAAVKQAIQAGCNVIDSEINYRCQRSERTIGEALAELIQDGASPRADLGGVSGVAQDPRPALAGGAGTAGRGGGREGPSLQGDPVAVQHRHAGGARYGDAVFQRRDGAASGSRQGARHLRDGQRAHPAGAAFARAAGGPASSVGGGHRRTASLAVRPLDAGHRNGAGRDEAGGPCPGQHGARAACAVVF